MLLAPLLACGMTGKNTAPSPSGATPPTGREDQSVEQMLTGRFPGVTVDHAAGGGLRIGIRGGANSMSGGEEPLIIVDDVPLPQGNGGVIYVNPSDIAKIEVLKNPSDTALYGMRGANGVIKVTTKVHPR